MVVHKMQPYACDLARRGFRVFDEVKVHLEDSVIITIRGFKMDLLFFDKLVVGVRVC